MGQKPGYPPVNIPIQPLKWVLNWGVNSPTKMGFQNGFDNHCQMDARIKRFFCGWRRLFFLRRRLGNDLLVPLLPVLQNGLHHVVRKAVAAKAAHLHRPEMRPENALRRKPHPPTPPQKKTHTTNRRFLGVAGLPMVSVSPKKGRTKNRTGVPDSALFARFEALRVSFPPPQPAQTKKTVLRACHPKPTWCPISGNNHSIYVFYCRASQTLIICCALCVAFNQRVSITPKGKWDIIQPTLRGCISKCILIRDASADSSNIGQC